MKEVNVAIDDTWTLDRRYYKSPDIQAGDMTIIVRLDFFRMGSRSATGGIVSFEISPCTYYTAEIEDFHQVVTPDEAIEAIIEMANRIAPAFGLHLVWKGGKHA